MLLLNMLQRELRDADDGDTGGGGGDGSGSGQVNDQLRNLLKRHDNDWAAVAGQLFSENYQLRSERRDLRKQVKDAENQVPEGAVVLTGEDAKRYEQLKDLGDPKEVQSRLSELQTLRRDARLREMVDAHGLKESAVRNLLPQGAEIVVEGEGDKRSFSLKTGDDATKVDELLEGDWKEFLPVLKPDESGKNRRVMGQRGDAEGGKRDVVSEYLANHTSKGKQGSDPASQG